MKTFALFIFLVATVCQSAEYKLTFRGNFGAGDFTFPRNSHFSPVVAATHNRGYVMFPAGGVSTDGVKSVAETGNSRLLWGELETHRRGGSVLDMKRSGSSFSGTDEVSLTVTAFERHPNLSLISMIAPSPDWVVGVSGLSLLSESGAFLQEIFVPLYAIDAGTDSGGEFTSANKPTVPRERIRPLEYVGDGVDIKTHPFAYLTIERID